MIMTELIACLSTGKGSWGHVAKVISEKEWSKILLVTNDFGREKFTFEKPAELIMADLNQPIDELIKQLAKVFKEKVTDTEVAVNLASGSGKEHMAILAAIMKAGLSFRLMALTKEGVKEI